MDDVDSGSNEARIFKEALPNDDNVSVTSNTPEVALTAYRADQPSPDAGATMVAASLRPDSQHGVGGEVSARTTDRRTEAELRPASDDQATVVSGAAAVHSTPPANQNVPGMERKRDRASAILLETGSVLGGRYEILQSLGEGGMGAVYKACDREVNRIVALKVIRPEMASDPEILGRFKQELLLSSQVTDRHVIRIYDLGEAQGVKFITMEFVDGDNLHVLLKQRAKLEIAEAVEIMEQVTSGLAAAHREGIIHRDLKPANIMCDKNGRVVVMDFGLARTFAGDGMTGLGAMMGTMEYMSPEQAQGKDLQASSDIFTAGLILYELLTGTSPFHAESAIASLVMRTQQRAVPLVSVNKNIPGTLSNIVSKCLEKDPARRYQSAEHLNADLRAWQAATGSRTKPTATKRLHLNQMPQLPWLRVGIAFLLVAAIAAGAGWYWIDKHKASKLLAHGPVSVVVGDFANHTGDPVLDDTLEPMLGVALEGASFINVYSRGDARKIAKKLPNPTDKLDEQSARLVALNQGIHAVITGDITLRDDQYNISAIALDSLSGKVLATSNVTAASKQEILSELPKLAVPLRKALGDTTPASLQFEKVSGGFRAASLEAVHQDALGVEEQFAGKFQEAFDSFQKAAQLDPKFARAYTGMAAMAQNLGRAGDALKYMQLAMQNVDEMTERERFRNQGLYYLTAGDWQKCVQQYSLLVTRYPADRVGQNNLASCYTQLRDAPKALEAAQHAVEITPRGVGQRLNLAFISAFAGDFPESEKAARAALEISPQAAQGYLVLAEAQLGAGQVSEAAKSYGGLVKFGALGASTAADGLADLAAYQANYVETTRLLTEGAATDIANKMHDNAARKYATLANVEQMQGHSQAALGDIGKALSGSPSIQVRFLAARIFVEAGDLPKAQKIATGLASQASSEPQTYSKIIAGMIALKHKDAKQAVAEITAANSLLDTWIGRFELGRADLQAGAFKDADAEFDRCIKRRGEALELFMDNVPTYSYFPPVYYWQGRAREELKRADFADSYKSYLSIRGKSADDPVIQALRGRIGQ